MSETEKATRVLFNVTCIVLILVLPYFILELVGIVDYVKENEHDGA